MKKLLVFIMTIVSIYSLSLEGLLSKYPIGMELNFLEEGKVEGDYYYLKYKTPIKLIGTYNEEKVELEYVKDGNIEEEFDLYFTKDFDGRKRLIGYWTMGNRKLEVEVRQGEIDFDNINPLDDMYIEEIEMKLFPHLVFNNENIDLGSGYGSPTEVEYYGNDSLVTLLYNLGVDESVEEIRSDGSSFHSGTIIHAQRRFYLFNLLNLTYNPQNFDFQMYHSLEEVKNWLLKWSFDSIYNRNLYKKFEENLTLVNEEVFKFYKKNYNEKEAKEYTEKVIKVLIERAGGTFSSYYKEDYTKISPLLNAIIIGKSNEEIISNGKKVNKDELIEGIKAAILLNKDYELVKELIKIDTNTINDVFHVALDNSNLTENLLNDFEINLELENAFGKTAIFYGVQYNNLDAVKILVENGANINKQYKNTEDISWEFEIYRGERSVFMHAVMHSDIEILYYLVENNIDIHTKDELGENALSYTLDEKKLEYLKKLKIRLE